MLKVFIILTSVTLFVGCDQSISDFVSTDRRQRPPTKEAPVSVTNNSPMTFKVSPGSINSSTSGGAGTIRGNSTITNRVISLGSDMAMSVSINRNRLVPN